MPTYPYRYLCNVEIDPDQGGLAKFTRGITGQYQEKDAMLDAWQGAVEADDEELGAERVFVIHNQDDRPTGRICPSMSVGDVAVVGTRAFACQSVGWVEVGVPTNIFAGSWMDVVALMRERA